MNLRPIVVFSGLLVAAFSSHHAAWSQSAKTTSDYVRPLELAWTDEKLTGNDKPYIRIQADIDRAIKGGQKPLSLMQRYKEMAKKQPLNPQAQFRWAYVTDLAAAATHDRKSYNDVQKSYWDISRALAQPVSPRAYHYYRLRYLIEVQGVIFKYQMKDVGKRLLRRNPNDWDVKYFLTDLLQGSEDLVERRQLALKYANDLVSLRPKKPSGYTMLGSVYWGLAAHFKSPAYADKAIAAYRKYLQLAPANYGFRKQAQNIIRHLGEQKERWQKQ